MEPPRPRTTATQTEKEKQMQLEWMEPDVIEIPPPPIPFGVLRTGRNNNNNNKKKLLSPPNLDQAILPEVINLDEDEDYFDKDEDFSDLMILDEKVDIKKKGKAIISNGNDFNQAKEAVDNCLFGAVLTSVPASDNAINLDDFDCFYDDNGVDDDHMYSDDFMHFDEYASLQSHFDNVDIPAGVEALVPWFPDYVDHTRKSPVGSFPAKTSQMQWNSTGSSLPKPEHVSKKTSSVTRSSFPTNLNSMNRVSGLNLSSKLSHSQAAQSKKLIGSQQGGSTSNLPTFSGRKAHFALSTSNANGSGNQFQSSLLNGVGHTFLNYYNPFNVNNSGGLDNLKSQGGSSNLDSQVGSSNLDSQGNNLFNLNSHPLFGGLDHPPSVAPPISRFQSKIKSAISEYTSPFNSYSPFHPLPDLPQEKASRTPKNVDRDDILRKLELFKQFDTVEDHSDHHYTSQCYSMKHMPKNWAKRIQEEWRILQNDLPDSIFVRVYETRMDLLRAVIVGAEGTPYHDGLFFFDMLFPGGYPNVPPQVHYHAGGLRLNPNLYSCGKVCLSLLGTWHGNKNEKWQPGVSTVLQVLVSIQALILNQKPFFNEPGCESMSGSPHGELQSQQYNENTFLLSLRTMAYTIRNPPKHFEDFVLGHFHKHANDILVACRSYIDGAQVGSLVKGGVQDVDEGDKSCSKSFKDSLPGHVDVLVKEFGLIGIKDCQDFQTVAKTRSNPIGNSRKAGIRVNS